MYGTNQMVLAQTRSPGRNLNEKAHRANEPRVEGEDFYPYWQRIAASEEKTMSPERRLTRESKSDGSQTANGHETTEVGQDVNVDEESRQKKLSGQDHEKCGALAEGVLPVVLLGTSVSEASNAAARVEEDFLADTDNALGDGGVMRAWPSAGRGTVVTDEVVSSSVDVSVVDSGAILGSSRDQGMGELGRLALGPNSTATGLLGEVDDIHSSAHSHGGDTGTTVVPGPVGSPFKTPGQVVLARGKGIGLLGTGWGNASSIGRSSSGAEYSLVLDPTGRLTFHGKTGGHKVDAAAPPITEPMALGTNAARAPEASSAQHSLKGLVAANTTSVTSEIDQAMAILAARLESMDPLAPDAYLASIGSSRHESGDLGQAELVVQLDGTSVGANQRGDRTLPRFGGGRKEVGNTYLVLSTSSFAPRDLQDGVAIANADSSRRPDLLAENMPAESSDEVLLSQSDGLQGVSHNAPAGPGSRNSLNLASQLSSTEVAEMSEETGNSEDEPRDILGWSSEVWIDSNPRSGQMDTKNDAGAVRKLPSPQEIVDQLVERVRIGHSGTDEMHIQLKPDWLGEVKIKIAVENGLVTAHFVAESQTVKSLIESGMSLLRENLENQGFSLAEFTVDVSNGQMFGNSGFSGDGQSGYQPGEWMPNGDLYASSPQVAGVTTEYVDPAGTRNPVSENLVDYLA